MRLNLNNLINYNLEGKNGVETCPICEFHPKVEGDVPSYGDVAHFTLCPYHSGWVDAFRRLDEEFDLFRLKMDGDYE